MAETAEDGGSFATFLDQSKYVSKPCNKAATCCAWVATFASAKSKGLTWHFFIFFLLMLLEKTAIV